ncbi:MAG: IS21 family transposase [Gemmatimonadaceae bacterium]
MITEHQYQRLMKTLQDPRNVRKAAMKAGMHRHTASKYLRQGHGPRKPTEPRARRRPDPLGALWPEAERFLANTPELEAKALFEHLIASLGTEAAALSARALRTFQRRVQAWRRHHGPPKEVFFPQVLAPGQWIQVDWTHADELGVTLAGQPFAHLLCHAVLPFSNAQWAVPCLSESLLSLKVGLQDALQTFGGAPLGIQTDQSSTATHQLKRGEAARGFNHEYLALCAHLDLKPRTINKACPQENGDIESANGHLKRRLKAHLALRGSGDFATLADYAAFVAAVCRGANALRAARFAEERATLRALPATRYPEAEETAVRVSSFSTIRVKNHAYSVPARLIGAMLVVELSEQTVVARLGREEVLRCPRSTQGPRIDYRHVIASLRRKPGAFAGYQYREELFPRPVFRQAYDALLAADAAHANATARADRHYIELLALAAEHGEDEVGAALGAALREGEAPTQSWVEPRVRATPAPAPSLPVLRPELSAYDRLLAGEVAA